MTGKPPRTQSRTPVKDSPRAVTWWYGLMAFGGFAFGLIGERRPFGSEVIAHPFVVFAIATCGALLLLRVVLARPVPELIPDRSLLLGCFVGLAMFLAGNFVAAHVGVGPF